MARHLIVGTLRQWTPQMGPIAVGTSASLSRSFSLDEVRKYAELSGDDNPIHVDAEYAKTTKFGKPIVHGMFFGSMFGTIFGASIPGAVYVSQDFTFMKPVFVGEKITANIIVQKVIASPRHIAECRTEIVKENGEIACQGVAKVMLPKPQQLA